MSSEDRESEGKTVANARVREILSAYGANPQAWPAHERPGVEAALSKDADLQDLAAAESILDARLARAASVTVSAQLGQRLMADFEAFAERQRAKLRVRFARAMRMGKEFVWPGAPWWKPAVALSLSVFVGLSAGMFVLAPLTEFDAGDQVVASLIDAPQSAYLEQDD